MGKTLAGACCATALGICLAAGAGMGGELNVPSINVPKAKQAVPLDAQVDGPAWQGAAIIDALTPCIGTAQPDKAGEIPVTVKLMWDSIGLHIGFICVDSDIFCTKTTNDRKLYEEDVCEIFLDPKGDSRQWYEIEISPKNVRFTMSTALTCEPKSDPASGLLDGQVNARDTWGAPDWEIEGLATATAPLMRDGAVKGWMTQALIPAKILLQRTGGKALEPGMAFRCTLVRYDWRPGTAGTRELLALSWTPIMNGCPHLSPSRMGRLCLVRKL